MKLNIKLAALAASAVLVSAASFANDDGMRAASASAVEDDAYYFMDVLDWSKLKFNKAYGFTSLDSDCTTTVNGGAAVKAFGGTVAAYVDGNLWSTPSKNTAAVFYGTGNLGVKFSVDADIHEDYSNGFVTDMTLDTYVPAISVGYNVTNNISVVASGSYGNAKTSGIYDSRSSSDETTYIYQSVTYTDTDPAFEVAAVYRWHNSKTMYDRIKLSYGYSYAENKVSSTSASYVAGYNLTSTTSINTTATTENKIALSYALQYKPTANLTYGLYAEVPYTISGNVVSTGDGTTTKSTDNGNTQTVDFKICNGISAEMIPEKFYVNCGLITTLPELTFSGDDVTRGSFSNIFYGGLSVMLSQNVRLDGYAQVAPTDGISLEEMWNQKLSLSLQAKF